MRLGLQFYADEAAPLLPAGTVLHMIGIHDNTAANPHNPDPDSLVTWGDQTYHEMMVGFFDVAVPADMGKAEFFERGRK